MPQSKDPLAPPRRYERRGVLTGQSDRLPSKTPASKLLASLATASSCTGPSTQHRVRIRERDAFAQDDNLFWQRDRTRLFKRAIRVCALCDHALRFLNRDGLPGIDIRQLVYLPAGPLNLEVIRFGLRSQPERQY